MKLLSEAELGRFNGHLERVLVRLLDAEGLAPMRDAITRYVLAGGKRIRPQLCIWTWQRSLSRPARPGGNVSGLPDCDRAIPMPLLDIAAGWELFHAFLLAHDDIIDEAEHRRDQPALHRQLALLDHNSPKFGRDLAIVAGDLLFSAAIRLWHELDVEPAAYRRLLHLFSRIATTTGFGQAIDICQSQVALDDVREDLLLREYHWKTAAYTFEGPMLSGAILAGAGEPTLAAIARYALSLGQAYQLQNDLLDLSVPVHEGSDLVQGKRTPTIMRCRLRMPADRRADFDRRLLELQYAKGTMLASAEALRRELLERGAGERTREMIGDFLSAAESAAGSESLPGGLRAGMMELLSSLRLQYFTAPQA